MGNGETAADTGGLSSNVGFAGEIAYGGGEDNFYTASLSENGTAGDAISVAADSGSTLTLNVYDATGTTLLRSATGAGLATVSLAGMNAGTVVYSVSADQITSFDIAYQTANDTGTDHLDSLTETGNETRENALELSDGYYKGLITNASNPDWYWIETVDAVEGAVGLWGGNIAEGNVSETAGAADFQAYIDDALTNERIAFSWNADAGMYVANYSGAGYLYVGGNSPASKGYNILCASTFEDVFPVDGPRTNLLENGVSQVLAWDGAQGKVGFMGTNGNPSPGWHGVWEWSGAEAALWKVVGAGHFAGSEVNYDGILLYNGIGNTFAAWTNLNDPSYGYVSLCHVDGNFQTKCLGDFDGNGFDDVIIFNELGSVGIVSDAAGYHDVWHVDDAASNPWQLLGAGTFDGAIGQDSLLFKNTSNNHLYLWDNQGADLSTWNWRQTDIGYLADGWEFAAIGDFAGDGIDDIVLVNRNDNDAVFVWDDGIQSTQHYVGVLGAGFKIETVGDYDGDGKDDLLLREYNSGWGGIGCWSGADANKWTDFNARIETNMESKFTIVA